MQVDRRNFSKAFAFITKNDLIRRSDAVAIDLEFTGMRFDNNEKERNEDLLCDRYDKMRNVARRYAIIQVGVSFFERRGEGVVAHPFNFYVYPRAYKNIDPVICLQSSSIEFNTKNGMDWNRWIRDGVTYIPLDKITEALAVPEKASYEELEVKLKEEQRTELNRVIVQLDAFKDNSQQELTTEVSSTFLRLMVQKLLEKSYPTLYLQPFGCGSPLRQKLLLSLRKVNSQDKQSLKQQHLLSILGFTALFQQLWRNPHLRVICHNGLFDLMYIYNSFVGDLPTSYMKFKEDVNNGFPQYYDTRLIAKQFGESFENGRSLEELKRVILGEGWGGGLVQVELAEGFQAYDWEGKKGEGNVESLHEAGYDSFVTGWIFYQLAKRVPDLTRWQARIPVIRSVWQINLRITSDTFLQTPNTNTNTLLLTITITKPNEYIPNLFDYKRKKTYETVQLLNSIFTKGKYSKDDVRIRQYKVDYVFVELRNGAKRREFVADMFAMREKGLDVRSFGAFVRRGLLGERK